MRHTEDGTLITVDFRPPRRFDPDHPSVRAAARRAGLSVEDWVAQHNSADRGRPARHAG